MKAEIEHALHEHTPDLLNVEYEDTIAPVRPPKLVQILPRQPIQRTAVNEFYMAVIRPEQIPENSLHVVETIGINLLLCNVAGTIYAFQNACAEDAAPLGESVLENGILICPCHGYQFDVRQKGRSLNNSALRLEALPSKVENDVVKVAFAKE